MAWRVVWCGDAGKPPWEPLQGLAGCAVGIADVVDAGEGAAADDFVCVPITDPTASQKRLKLLALSAQNSVARDTGDVPAADMGLSTA